MFFINEQYDLLQQIYDRVVKMELRLDEQAAREQSRKMSELQQVQKTGSGPNLELKEPRNPVWSLRNSVKYMVGMAPVRVSTDSLSDGAQNSSQSHRDKRVTRSRKYHKARKRKSRSFVADIHRTIRQIVNNGQLARKLGNRTRFTTLGVGTQSRNPSRPFDFFDKMMIRVERDPRIKSRNRFTRIVTLLGKDDVSEEDMAWRHHEHSYGDWNQRDVVSKYQLSRSKAANGDETRSRHESETVGSGQRKCLWADSDFEWKIQQPNYSEDNHIKAKQVRCSNEELRTWIHRFDAYFIGNNIPENERLHIVSSQLVGDTGQWIKTLWQKSLPTNWKEFKWMVRQAISKNGSALQTNLEMNFENSQDGFARCSNADLKDWLLNMESYLVENNITGERMLHEVYQSLKVPTGTWIKELWKSNPPYSWEDFKRVIRQEAEASPRGFIDSRYSGVLQGGSVLSYCREFSAIPKQSLSIPEKYALEVFVRGLRHPLQAEVRQLQPKRLIEVMDIAVWLEEMGWNTNGGENLHSQDLGSRPEQGVAPRTVERGDQRPVLDINRANADLILGYKWLSKLRDTRINWRMNYMTFFNVASWVTVGNKGLRMWCEYVDGNNLEDKVNLQRVSKGIGRVLDSKGKKKARDAQENSLVLESKGILSDKVARNKLVLGNKTAVATKRGIKGAKIFRQ